MAKTMRRIVITALVLILLAGVACFALFTFGVGTPVEGVRTTALNTFIDKAGIKEAIKTSLSEQVGKVAEDYNIPEEITSAGIDLLAIDDWKVVDTPSSDSIKKTVEFDVDGSPVQVTLYDDPSLVSVRGYGKINTLGTTVTFEVPECAQTPVSLLPYADAAEELDVEVVLDGLAKMYESITGKN